MISFFNNKNMNISEIKIYKYSFIILIPYFNDIKYYIIIKIN